MVVLVAQNRRDQIIQRQRQIHSIEKVVVQGRARGVVDGPTEVAQILLVLPASRLLLPAAGGVERVVHLVERPVRIETFTFEQLLFGLLDEDLHAVEFAVPLSADGERFTAGTAAPVVAFEGEVLPQIGLVAVGAVEVEFVHARSVLAILELGAVVESELEVLLRGARRAAPANVDVHVVVELAEIVDRTARAAARFRGRNVLDEPVQYGQGCIDARVLDDRTIILR